MAFDVEQLFQSIDIILTQRLQDVNFDKTIICTIVDDSDKKNGCYVVSDGTIKFKAYVSDATYRVDDQVRVSVLNGDFSEKKFITGRYTGDENSTPITYKSPLESIIPITNNLVTETLNNNQGVNGLTANSNIIQKELWRADLTSNQEFRDLQSNGIYNTLTIKADFKTLLSHYDLISGNYGLRLDLFIQPSFDNPTQRIRKYVTLDSSEMMGNPYSFSVYSTQAKKVDIVSTGVIAEMVLWLYQSINGDGEGRRFIEKDGNEIPVNKLTDGTELSNILVKNIEIGFGSDIEKVADNTLEIFTSSSPYYVYQDPTEANNKKEIELLWYNKTDENKYIGFSDGLFDLNYDEIEYLKVSNQDARLCAQIGRNDIPSDESGLKLAADLKDAKPIMLKARDALTQSVADVLYSFQRQVKSVKTISDKLDLLLDTANGNLVTQWNLSNEAIENWNNSYIKVLQYAYNKQNQVENIGSWDSFWNTDYYKVFTDAINLGIKKVRDFFVWVDGETQPSAGRLSAYRGSYDLYLYRVEKELSLIEDWLNQLDELLDKNHERLIAYKNLNYKFYEYKVVDFSSYANKYCIYWYRYEPGYKLEYKKDSNNDEYHYGNFVGDGWHRLNIVDKNNQPLYNLGLPREEDINNPGYYPAKSLGQALSRLMDKNLTEEKYIVVLFHNHEMFKSNVITFTNSEPELIPNDALIDKHDALKIEHDVASFEHYQSYNEFNLLRSLEDGGKIRQLKCFYDGLFKGDEALINASLYWYVPNHSTMLTFDKEDLIKEGFATDADESTDYSIPGYTYFYKKIRQCEEEDRIIDENGNLQYTCRNEDRYFFYKIKPQLEKDAQNNTIRVKAYLEGVSDPVEGEITMTFSAFGTNGTKYTLSIVPSTSQVSVGGKNSPLQLAVSLKDSKNNPIEIIDANSVSLENGSYGFSVESWKNLPNAFAWNIIYDTTSEKTTKPIIGLSVFLPKETVETWDEKTPYFGIINAKVNFRIDKNEDLEESQKVSEYQKYRVVDLNTLYAITYSSSDMYYMSGATHIVYNNQGIVSYVSEDKYELYIVNEKGNTPVENQIWSIRYYDKNGNWITEKDKDWPMLRNYMPVLNSENRLTPAPLYINNLDYIPVVICTVNENIAWVQPIIITQNQYASSTLNDWNGSFTIDEKNGTILSTALGAGKKETDNSFSGVLMGDIGKGMNFDTDNMDGLGIYGFNKGAQSFCLSADGRAFFGKAGRGRIYIDGDSGTIASASYEMVRRNYLSQPETAGMLIDLDDGYIHMLGSTIKNNKYEPDHPEGQTAQAEVLLSTGMLNGMPDAYFKIRSKQQTNKDHYLIYVDSDKYYLQTDDYSEVDFNEGDGGISNTGSGLRLDLKDGVLNGYNFRLSSKNVMINSSDKSTAFFIIKNDDGNNLFYAGPDNYYLKSNDFESMSSNSLGSGLKLTLMNFPGSPSGIEAYNFDLRAGNVNGDHAIILSDSGNPYFMVNADANGTTKTLVNISKTEQSFQSSDYNGVDTGIRLSLSGKELKAYSGFLLKAYSENHSGNFISINANAEIGGYPLQVSDNFKVDWAGNLTAVGGTFTGTIHATGGTITGSLTATGTISGGTIDGAEITGGSININDKFTVDSNGRLVCTSAEIGGWEVKNNSTGFTNGSMTFNPGSGISSPYWNTSKDGKTTIKHLEVEERMTAVNSANFYITGANNFYITDANWIYLSADYIKITGAIGIGGNPYKNAGGIRVAGDVSYIGDIYCGDPSDSTRGVTEDYTVKTGWFKSSTLHFTKGILTKVDNGDTDSTNLEFPPVTGQSGKFLTTNGSTLSWAYVKKKFKVTMTGQVKNLYTTSDGVWCYTGINWGYETWYDSNGYRHSVPVYYGASGGATRYSRTKAGNITLTGTSSEITLDSSTNDQNPIEITITNTTAS